MKLVHTAGFDGVAAEAKARKANKAKKIEDLMVWCGSTNKELNEQKVCADYKNTFVRRKSEEHS